MADEKQAPVAVDINSPDIQMEELANLDTEKDQFVALPALPDGTYRVKLVQKKPSDLDAFWISGETKKGVKYLRTGLEAVVIDPAGKFDAWRVFDNFVSTMVQPMTGTNKIVGILKALGVPVPLRVTNVELARLLDQALAGEPEVAITTQWEGYCETCDKTVVKGEKRFPKNKDGGHDPVMECPKDGTTVSVNPRILKYLSVAQQQAA